MAIRGKITMSLHGTYLKSDCACAIFDNDITKLEIFTNNTILIIPLFKIKSKIYVVMTAIKIKKILILQQVIRYAMQLDSF